MSETVYLDYFGLQLAPFAITPNPQFVYLSSRHQDALAHLLYGVGQGGSGGFVQLTGEVGTGKTTLCRCLLEQVPDDTHIALILNPLLTPTELVASICEELGLDTRATQQSRKQLVDQLNHYLLEKHAVGERVVVVIDEAQNLSPQALEQVRLLTNLETDEDKLLQIVLLGQPELRDLLNQPSLRQLAQRITARFHLTPLQPTETAAYVKHRFAVAGGQHCPFTPRALSVLHRASGGVPRLINIIADRALVAAYAKDQRSIGPKLVRAAAVEVQPLRSSASSVFWRWLATASLVLLAVALVAKTWPWRVAESLAEPKLEQVVATPEPPVSVAALDQTWLNQHSLQAWQQFADLWQAPLTGDFLQSHCDGKQYSGYGCLLERGSWARIQRLQLPVVLKLQQPQQWLLLRGIQADRLLVGGGDRQQTISLASVDQRWFGEFAVLWPQGAGWPPQLSRGAQGETVATLYELAALHGADFELAEPALFDQSFEYWIQNFQREHGLVADGIVGPNTLIYLLAPAIESPRLRLEW